MVNYLDLTNAEHQPIMIAPLFRKYYNYFNSIIIHQEHVGTLSFFQILGCIAQTKGIKLKMKSEDYDLRTSMIWFSPSGTGKGLTINLIHEFLDRIGIKNKNIKNQVTSQALVGSFDDSTHERNMLKGYSPENPKWRNPKITGIMEENLYVSFDEVQWMFETTKGDDCLTILRMVADNYGTKSNLISSDTLKAIVQQGLEYHSPVTFLTSSYFVPKVKSIITQNGIFQRVATHFSNLTQEQLDEIIEFNNLYDEKERKGLDRRKGEIIELLKQKLNSPITEIRYNSKEVAKFFNEHYKQYLSSLRDKHSISQEELKDYFVRGRNMVLKYAGLNAFLHDRSEITEEDIILGVQIVYTNLDTIYQYILTNAINEKEETIIKIIRLIINPNKWYSKTELRDELCKSRRWQDGRFGGKVKTSKLLNDISDYFIIEKNRNNPNELLHKLKYIK